MTDDEMRTRSAEKVNQVLALMKSLDLRVEARQRVTGEGFLENTIFWLDEEKYIPAQEVITGPVGETLAQEVEEHA